jgi:hypothetical protein
VKNKAYFDFWDQLTNIGLSIRCNVADENFPPVSLLAFINAT